MLVLSRSSQHTVQHTPVLQTFRFMAWRFSIERVIAEMLQAVVILNQAVAMTGKLCGQVLHDHYMTSHDAEIEVTSTRLSSFFVLFIIERRLGRALNNVAIITACNDLISAACNLSVITACNSLSSPACHTVWALLPATV